MITGTKQIGALLEEVQALKFELHVRDTPELVVEFGAGTGYGPPPAHSFTTQHDGSHSGQPD